MANKELQRWIPQGDLANRSERELARVGLSPAFPANLALLNEGFDILIENYGAVQTGFLGYRFNLRPDDHLPTVGVDALYNFPFKVEILAPLKGLAKLAIEYDDDNPMGGGAVSLGRYTFEELQSFIDIYPTDEPINLSAKLRERKESDKPELPDSITVDFKKLQAAEDLRDLGLIPTRYSFRLGFETPTSSFRAGITWPEVHQGEYLYLGGLTAIDSAANIETVVGNLGGLLTRTLGDE